MQICIFCKEDASTSASKEHIIPESLGGWDQILPAGIVCDRCNNYFARKVEAPILNEPSVRNLRLRQRLRNKSGNYPVGVGVIAEPRIAVKIHETKDRTYLDTFCLQDRATLGRWLDTHSTGRLILSHSWSPPKRAMSRLLAKIALEALASRLLVYEGWRTEVVDNLQLDQIRQFARFGGRPEHWPYSERQIYGEDAVLIDPQTGDAEQILNELYFLYTEGSELYCIVAIFGKEFAINLGGPSIEGYELWLSANRGNSPLYEGDESGRLPQLFEPR